MTYTKTYYRQSSQKGFVDLEKTEEIECQESHEDEYYLWVEDKACYIKCICSGWQA